MILIRGQVFYTSQESLTAYPNIALVTTDWVEYFLPRAVLGIMSTKYRAALLDPTVDRIHVEMDSEDFLPVLRFLTRGELPVTGLNEVMANCRLMGMRLNELEMTKVRSGSKSKKGAIETTMMIPMPAYADELPMVKKSKKEPAEKVQERKEESSVDTKEDSPKREACNYSDEEDAGVEVKEKEISKKGRRVLVPIDPSQIPRGAKVLPLPSASKQEIAVTEEEEECVYEVNEEEDKSEEPPSANFMCHYCQTSGFAVCRDMREHRKYCEEFQKEFAGKEETHLTCDFCNLLTPDFATLNRHVAIHNSNWPEMFMTQCPHCGVPGSHLETVAHMRQMGKYHNLNCTQCTFHFENFDTYTDHVNKEHEGIWKYRCGRCFQLFDVKEAMEEHSAKDCPYKGVCRICKKAHFHNYLRRHMVEHHGLLHFKCTSCLRAFPEQKRLEEHLKAHENQAVCDQCGKGFLSKGQLERHIISVHMDEKDKPVQCNECPRGFGTPSQLAEHQLIHNDILPHLCSHCGKSFRRREYFFRHLEQVHEEDISHLKKRSFKGAADRVPRVPRRSKCKHCHMMFDSLRDYHEHMKVAHQEISPEEISCSVCQRKFGTKSSLKTHVLAQHTEDKDKPFQCSYCAKGFVTKTSKTSHENTHTNTKPYQCEECGVSFRCNSQKSTHMSRKHNAAPKRKKPRKFN